MADDVIPSLGELFAQGMTQDIVPIRPRAGGGLFSIPPPAAVPMGGQYPLPLDLPIMRRGIKAYHGSTEPDLKELNSRMAVETPGTTWHTSEPDVAHTFTVPREYGEPVWTDRPGAVYETQIAAKNPLVLHGREAQEFSDYNSREVIDAARRRAHDVIIARDVKEGIGNPQRSDVYAVLNDAAVKLLGKLDW